MAGSYPDVPSRRMAYDADGSVVLRIDSDGDVLEELVAGDRAKLNDETDTTAVAVTAGDWVAIIFPEVRELDGVFLATNGGTGMEDVSSSADTTNGYGGSWTVEVANPSDAIGDTVVFQYYRDNIDSMAASSKRAIRAERSSGTNHITAFHVYGEIAPGETPDRLLIIDENTGVEFTAAHDYGDIPRGSSEDIEIRLENNSSTLTANTVQYTCESLYKSSGSWYTATLPGGATFQGTQQIASLASSTTTGIITLRRITPGSEETGLHAGRLYANVDSWS